MTLKPHFFFAFGLLLSLPPLFAGDSRLVDRASPPKAVASPGQESLSRTQMAGLAAVITLEATYDFTSEMPGAVLRYETRHIIANFVSGRYLIRSLHFRDPERKIGTGCSIESWDGAQYVRLDSGLRDASLADLAEGKSTLLGNVVVNSASGAWDPLWLSRRDLSGSRSLVDAIMGEIDADDHRVVGPRSLKAGSYEIEFLPNGKPQLIKMYGDFGKGSEILRRFTFGRYQEINGILIPTEMEANFRSVDGQNGEWREVWQARLHPATITVNAPLKEADFRFKLPAGVQVQDRVQNITYTVPRDPEEFSGKDSKNNLLLGLQEMSADKRIWAKSLLGQKGPDVVVEKWLTPPPELKGKFVLVDFWATWCGPCLKSIPGLNELQEKFGDKLTVVGITGEDEQSVRALKEPVIKYALGIDPENRMVKAVEVQGFPHVILMDPEGVVRWEGFPLLKGQELTNHVVAEILGKYGR